ncbi:MAG TPA: tetratricopeptide repeat protein [Longimicrobium sp.]|nr:tetratricopeptide repeat protein [Longimicrobium sp.]
MHKRRRSSDAHLPPAPLDFAHPLSVRGAHTGDAALLEAAPPEHALFLWRVYHRLATWTGGPGAWAALGGGEQARDFEEAVLRHDFGDVALWAPLSVIATELRAPSRADPATLANASLSVADWALGRDAGAAALLFAELGAEAWPENPRIAWVAGKVARAQAAHREAALWFRRAARVAVWNEDWEAQSTALNSLGNLHLKTGDYPEARRQLMAAYRVAARHRMHGRRAKVLHDLFVVAVMTGEYARAERYAADACAAYGPGHPHLLRLAFDISHLWLQQGHFGRVLRVLKALLPNFDDTERRLVALSCAARAAGAVGEPDEHLRYASEAWTIIGAEGGPGKRAGAALEIGLGALSLSRWDDAKHALDTARATAVEDGEADTLARVDAALDHLHRYESADAAPLPSTPRSTRPAEVLSRELVRSLEAGCWNSGEADSQHPAWEET